MKHQLTEVHLENSCENEDTDRDWIYLQSVVLFSTNKLYDFLVWS